MSAGRHLLAAACVIGCVACGGETDPTPPGAIAFRFIEDDPAEYLRPDDLFDVEEVFRWTFDTEHRIAQWRFEGLRTEPVEGGRLRLQPTGEEPWLERAVDIDADGIDRISVRVAGLHAGRSAVRWAGRMQRFSDRRSLVIDAGFVEGDNFKVFDFNLQPHPLWKGRITRLQFDPIGAANAPVGLESITGTRFIPRPKRLADAVTRPWRVELDRESRIALLSPPGVEIERRIGIPQDASLRFGFGLQHGASIPTRFEVEIITADDGTRRVFSSELDPGRGDSARWHDATVSLDEFAGRTVGIRLVTRGDSSLGTARGMPVWSTPEVIGGPVPDLPNVVLVCLDTLRADRLSSYGCPRLTTPNLDALASADGVLFEQVVATSPWTLPSHVSMFTGLDAVRHGVNHYRAAPAALRMLAEHLRAAGYATAAITGGGYLRPQFGLDQGFDRFRYWADKSSKAELATGMDEALAWLGDHRGRPFFLFFHTYEVHFPHRRRQPWFDRLAGPELTDLPDSTISMESHSWKFLRAPGDFFVALRPGSDDWETPLTADEKRLVDLMYDSSVAYADHEVGRLLQRLDDLGLLDSTVLVVTSDHGEALGEDDRAGHSYLEDYNTLVPLIVRLPGRVGAGRRVAEQVRLTDLTPTILEAVGRPQIDRADGVSLLHLITGEPSRVPAAAWTYAASSNRGLAMRLGQARMKYTYNDTAWEQVRGEEKLVDLAADPEERHDLPNGERRAVFRQQVLSTLIEQQRGVRLLIRNRSAHLLKGRLRGALAAHDRLKSASDGKARVRWRDDVPPTFVVPRGEEMTLLLDSPDRDRAGINAHIVNEDGARSHRLAQWIDLHTLANPVAFELTAAGWRRVDDPSGPPETGFLLWWEGGLPDSAIAAPKDDAEVLEQLQALGYVQ